LRVLHIISNLGNGGAELQLKRITTNFSKNKKHTIGVISLTNKGSIGIELESYGIKVFIVNCRTVLIPVSIIRLFFVIKYFKPDIIQTWMYHADFIGGILGKFLGVKKIFWGIRNTDIPQSKISLTYILRNINAKLSYFIPNLIICNSNKGMISHINLGFCKKKMITIPNSYEFYNSFKNLNEESLIREYNINKENIIIAGIGRFDKLKDFKNFIQASKIVSKTYPKVKFLLIGQNMDSSNYILMNWLKETSQLENFYLLGYQKNVKFFLNEIIDIFCLSSMSEGFPNVLIEAMAAEVPCVATNVGDVDLILEKNGIVVAPNNYHALAEGIIKMINIPLEKRVDLGKKTKYLIEKKYSVENISNLYLNVYNAKI